MKNKAIILIAISAVVSISFAFTSQKVNSSKKEESVKVTVKSYAKSSSGFLLEDKM